MLFYNTKTAALVTESELRKLMYPKTLAATLTNDNLTGTGFVTTQKGTRPETTVIQKAVVDGVVQSGDKYTVKYKVVDKYSGANKAELEAAALAAEKKKTDKEQALKDLQTTSITGITTIPKLQERLANIEKYLGI